MIRRNPKNIFSLFAAAAIMLACVPTLAPVATPVPTFDPNSIGTDIAATANAAATQTFLFTTPSSTPTFTATPTKTPSETPTPTPTFLYIIQSPTPSSTLISKKNPGSTEYACELLGQAPIDNSLIGLGALFSVRWQVKNTGALMWNQNDMDYRYKNGTKMHSQPAYDLYKNVQPGEIVDIIVDMTSPTTSGIYTTTWRLTTGKAEFCTLTLTINAK